MLTCATQNKVARLAHRLTRRPVPNCRCLPRPSPAVRSVRLADALVGESVACRIVSDGALVQGGLLLTFSASLCRPCQKSPGTLICLPTCSAGFLRSGIEYGQVGDGRLAWPQASPSASFGAMEQRALHNTGVPRESSRAFPDLFCHYQIPT